MKFVKPPLMPIFLTISVLFLVAYSIILGLNWAMGDNIAALLDGVLVLAWVGILTANVKALSLESKSDGFNEAMEVAIKVLKDESDRSE